MATEDNRITERKRTTVKPGLLEDVPLPSNIPGVNIALGLKNVREKSSLYRKLLFTFQRDHLNDGELLCRYFDCNDLVQAQRIAHTLKGISGTIGAVGLHSASTALNTALINGRSVDAVEPLIESVISALNQVVGSIEKLELHEEFAVLQCAHQPFEKEAIKALIEQLEELVDDMDPEASAKAVDVCCQLENSSLKPVAMNMLEELEMFEFEKAMLSLRMLKQWIETL